MMRAYEAGATGRRAVLTWALVCAAAGGFLSGCSGDADPRPAPVGTAADDEGSSPDGATEPPRLGPLDELLGVVLDLGEESPEAQLERLERTEEITAACMLEQGFEYTPNDWASVLAAQAEAAARRTTGDLVATATEEGYGIAGSWTEAGGGTAGTGPVDPNAERVAAMSGAEEEAWYLALWGPGQGEAYLEEREPYDWTKYGCSGRAGHETDPGDGAQFDDSAWTDLRDEILQLEETVQGDERLAGVHQDWSACMTEAGYPGYADPREPMAEMSQRSQEIWDQASAGVNLDLSTDDYLTDPAYLQQQAELARLHAELAPVEVALAVADATCRVELDYEARYLDTWIAIQEEYYEAHRADLDAWLAAFQEFEAANG